MYDSGGFKGYIATGCGTYEHRSLSLDWSRLCSAANWQDMYGNDQWGYVGACWPRYSGGKSCPKGWGTAHTYASFSAGCYYGSYYSSPVPAHAGPRDSVGSRLSTLITGLVLKYAILLI